MTGQKVRVTGIEVDGSFSLEFVQDGSSLNLLVKETVLAVSPSPKENPL